MLGTSSRKHQVNEYIIKTKPDYGRIVEEKHQALQSKLEIFTLFLIQIKVLTLICSNTLLGEYVWFLNIFFIPRSPQEPTYGNYY